MLCKHMKANAQYTMYTITAKYTPPQIMLHI